MLPERLDYLADALMVWADTPKLNLMPRLLQEWQKVEPMFRQLRGTQRAPVRLSDLSLKPDGGVQNIIKVWNTATAAEQDYWSDWYLDAHHVVQEIAERHQLPIPVVAAVVAILSPGNLWWINVRIADKLILFWKNKALSLLGKLSAYPFNVRKAIGVLEGADPAQAIGSPKVGVFYDSLVDPIGTAEHLTLDGHAINIWSGYKVPLNQVRRLNEALRRKIESDYTKAAQQLGVSAQALQVLTWYVWRSVVPQ